MRPVLFMFVFKKWSVGLRFITNAAYLARCFQPPAKNIHSLLLKAVLDWRFQGFGGRREPQKKSPPRLLLPTEELPPL